MVRSWAYIPFDSLDISRIRAVLIRTCFDLNIFFIRLLMWRTAASTNSLIVPAFWGIRWSRAINWSRERTRSWRNKETKRTYKEKRIIFHIHLPHIEDWDSIGIETFLDQTWPSGNALGPDVPLWISWDQSKLFHETREVCGEVKWPDFWYVESIRIDVKKSRRTSM